MILKEIDCFQLFVYKSNIYAKMQEDGDGNIYAQAIGQRRKNGKFYFPPMGSSIWLSGNIDVTPIVTESAKNLNVISLDNYDR